MRLKKQNLRISEFMNRVSDRVQNSIKLRNLRKMSQEIPFENLSQGLSAEEVKRYSRHLSLSEVGPEGQQKLKKSKVLIIGAGGLGCPVGLYLAAAGIGQLGIIDHDVVEISNLQRQIGHSEKNLGLPKTESLAETIIKSILN